jgi:hypothetical protein
MAMGHSVKVQNKRSNRFEGATLSMDYSKLQDDQKKRILHLRMQNLQARLGQIESRDSQILWECQMHRHPR